MKQTLSWILALVLISTLAVTLIFSRPGESETEPELSVPDELISELPSDPLIPEVSSQKEEPSVVPPAAKTVTVASSEAAKGPLTVVSAAHPLVFSRADEMVQFYKKYNNCYKFSTTELYMGPETLDAFTEMTAAFTKKTGRKDIALFSAYEEKDGTKDAASGRSLTLSIAKDNGAILAFTGQGDYEFFYSEGPQFGFILRYPAGKKESTGENHSPNRLRFVGVPHAEIITQKGLTLEEYTAMLAEKHDFAHPLSYTAKDGSSYFIYAVKAAAGSKTEIPLPDCKAYQISGDNCGNFIVTAKVA